MTRSRLVYYEVIEGKYNTDYYLGFLDRLYMFTGKSPKVALFFDGLAIHKTQRVVEDLICKKGWLPMLNVAYSPNHQPIESLFAQVKREYRHRINAEFRARLLDKEGEKGPRRDFVRESFEAARERDLEETVRHAEQALEATIGEAFDRSFERYTP